MRFTYKSFIIASLFVLLYASCEDAFDVYLGVPLQPRLNENGFKPGLNILGIIRTDSINGYNKSFVEVQKVMAAIGDSSGLDVDSATIIISKIGGGEAKTSVEFIKTTIDDIFKQENYRPNFPFTPKAGNVYNIECSFGDLPVLTSQAVVPNQPVIVENNINYSNGVLSFTLLTDSSFYMVEVYSYLNGVVSSSIRSSASQSSNTLITLTNLNTKPDSIEVFTYDKNLSTYYLTSNTSLNFNKYRASFSTVDNGYGTFGAMNQRTFIIP